MLADEIQGFIHARQALRPLKKKKIREIMCVAAHMTP